MAWGKLWRWILRVVRGKWIVSVVRGVIRWVLRVIGGLLRR